MFGRKSEMDSHVDTLVGPSSKINGDMSFLGRCHIDGVVKGNVNADPASESALSIAEDGRVEGGVTVPYLVLHGLVQGDVVAARRVELGPTARVIGNVYYNLIEMAIGAEINGKLVHRPEGKVPDLQRTNRMESPGPARPESVEEQHPEAGVQAVAGSST